MRRAAFVLIMPVAVVGCGSSGAGKTTITKTTTGATKPPAAAEGTHGGRLPKPSTLQADGAGVRIDVGDFFTFEMPSKRIGCAVTTDPTTLRCDTAFPTRFSRTGHTCEAGDYGQAFLLRRSGPARAICAGDTVLSANDAQTIPYGKTWLLGPYSCTSRETGLSCKNPDGHGLSLSLQAQKVF